MPYARPRRSAPAAGGPPPAIGTAEIQPARPPMPGACVGTGILSSRQVMIQGLISDIHGNLAALTSVIADMEENGAERVICLGDVVGYGPYPGECLDLVRRCGAVLMGNHEEALLFGAENFNPRAKRAIDWTRDH